MKKIMELQLNKIANEMFALSDLPKTHEEQIRRLAENPQVNRNFLMFEADRCGLDISDKIHGFDDGEGPRGGDYELNESND